MKPILISILMLCLANKVHATEESFCPGGESPNPAVLFCDSFESQGNNLEDIDSSRYYEFDNDDGDLKRTTIEAAHGQYSARVSRFISRKLWPLST